jgi:hypothetical protein
VLCSVRTMPRPDTLAWEDTIAIDLANHKATGANGLDYAVVVSTESFVLTGQTNMGPSDKYVLMNYRINRFSGTLSGERTMRAGSLEAVFKTEAKCSKLSDQKF